MPRPRPLHAGLLLAPVLLTACGSLQATEPGKAPPAEVMPATVQPAQEPQAADLSARAIAAIETGDLELATGLLAELRFNEDLAKGQAALAAGEPEDALVAIDRALGVHPDSPAALAVKADGAMLLATRMIERGMGAQFVEGAYLDALDAYASLPRTPASCTGASGAAAMLGRTGVALEFAREGIELLDDEATPAERAPVQRAWAQAAYRAYTAQLTFERQDASGEEPTASDLGVPADVLFNEADDALNQLVAYQPEESWTWVTLGDLMLWAGYTGEASTRFLAGLDHLPSDRTLVERYQASLAGQGPEAVVDALAAASSRLPGSAPLALALGRERLRAAVPNHTADPAATYDVFVQAESELAAARGLDPALTSECLSWEVIARAGQAWCAYNDGDLDAAADIFLSMEDVFEGGMSWSLGTELRSGVDGLFFIGDQERQRGDWEAAARAFEALSAYQPGDSNWANNAGFFCRDAAVEHELIGGALCDLAAGRIDDEAKAAEILGLVRLNAAEATPELLMALADEHFASAHDLAERSYQAYLRAAELAPEDVRIINDTALISVYYLHTELARAEELLLEAIRMGEEQLADGTERDEETLFDLTEAYGDALQNLGVLRMMHQDDAAGAIPLFEKSVEVGPLPRPLLTEALLPWCRGEMAEPLERVMPEVHWGRPASERVQ
ncbi:MAG: hypothetical protein P1V81_02825 [Planctomycetota bacterium]|nr:hypothetical protein [Planctomycetota bacterium]